MASTSVFQLRLIVGRTTYQWRVFAFLLLALAAQSIAAAQPAPSHQPQNLNTEQVVQQLVLHNQQRAALLKHYESCRYYSVDYVGFPSDKSAQMIVNMSYDAPAQKQFHIVKEQGSRLLLDHVLGELIQNEKEAAEKPNIGKLDLTPSNYDFQLIGTDTIAGQPQYVLEVKPRIKSKFLYQGKIWVDAKDFAVRRLSAQPARNVSFWISHTDIEHEYKKVGEFWLPAQDKSTTHVRFGGIAKLKIDYRDYRIGDVSQDATSYACVPGSQAQISEKMSN